MSISSRLVNPMDQAIALISCLFNELRFQDLDVRIVRVG